MGPAGWLPPGGTVAAHPLPAAQQVAATWPLIQESRAVVLPNVAISTAAPPARSQSMSCCAFESCGAWVTLPQLILAASELAAGPSLPQAASPAVVASVSADTAASIWSLIAPPLSGEICNPRDNAKSAGVSRKCSSPRWLFPNLNKTATASAEPYSNRARINWPQKRRRPPAG